MRIHLLPTALKFSILLLLSVLFTLPATDAFAQNSMTQAVELTKAAMNDYDFVELESADTKIMQAVQLIENAGVNDPGVANIYIAQGIIGYGRFKDSSPAIADNRAFAAFVKALSHNPDATIHPDYQSKDLDEIFARAKEAIVSSAATSVIHPVAPAFNPKDPEPEVKKTAAEIKHTVIASSDRCTPMNVTAVIPQHPDIYRILLFFAGDEQTKFNSIDMTAVPHSFPQQYTATIPEFATKGDHVRYYIETKNREDVTVASSGSSERPNNTLLMGECASNPDEETDNSKYGNPLFQFTLMAGTGFGYIKGDTTRCSLSATCSDNGTKQQKAGAGMASLPFHLKINGMFNIKQRMQVGVLVRFQPINWRQKVKNIQGNYLYPDDETWRMNVAFGASFRYFFLKNQPHRLFAGIALGYGGANATAPIQYGEKGNKKTFNDVYVYKGPVFIEPEFGFLLSLHKNVGLAFELDMPIYFPDRPSFHFDISVGPFFQF